MIFEIGYLLLNRFPAITFVAPSGTEKWQIMAYLGCGKQTILLIPGDGLKVADEYWFKFSL